MPAHSISRPVPRAASPSSPRGSLRGRFRNYAAIALLIIGGWLYLTIEAVADLYTLATTIARYSDLQGLAREAQSALANAEGGLDRFTQTGLGYDLARHHDGRAALRTAMSSMRNRIVTESIRGTAGRASAAEAVYRDAADSAISAFEANDHARAREVRDLTVVPVAQGLARLFDELHTAFARSVTTAENQLEDARRRATFFILGLAALLVFGIVLMLGQLSKRLVAPVGAAAGGLADLAQGRSPPRLPDASPDEIGELGSRFNQVTDLIAEDRRSLEERDIEASVNAVLSVAATVNDLDGFSDQVLPKLMEVTGADSAVLYLPGDDGALAAVREIGGSAGAAGREEADRAAREGRPIFVSVEAPSPTIHLWNGEILPQGTAHMPLIHSGATVGVLALAATSPFPARIRNALGAIAPSLAVALANAAANARLAQQSRRLAEQNQLLEEQRARLAETARELQRASALKDKFLASVSHELRTPMTVILGFTGSLLRGAQGELAPRQRESLDRVQRNARHLLQLINDVLDISRIEAGRAEVFPEPLDLAARFAQLEADYGEIALRKGVAFRTSVAAGLGSVRTDPTKLTQILHNLVGNALKFTERGSIDVRAEARGPERWALVVADTGVGIPESEQQTIFEEFRQGEAAQQEGRGGSGLGLSIVRQFARLLGGRVSLESAEGRGSVFTVELPREMPAAVDLLPTEARERSGATVLVVDDERHVRELLQYELAPYGLRVLEAPDGQAGLEIARRERPDAILLDVRIPGADGWEILRALKQDADTAGIPVVILSVVDERARGLALGAFDYVLKPVDREVLVAALRRAGVLPGGRPVLVVDDEEDLRELLVRELTAAGYRVRAAAGGSEALAALEEETPAAVVLDLLMPPPDGFEVLARLREREQSRDVPVVIVTAKELTAAERSRLDETARQVIRKGADLSQLVHEVLRAVAPEARPTRVRA